MGKERSWSRSVRRGEREKETPQGCMSSVFQLFDLHQILFRTTAGAHGRSEDGPLPLPQDPQVTSPRGLVAPRNSLEARDDAAALAITREEEYGILVGVRLVPEKKTPAAVRLQEIEEGRSSLGAKTAIGAGNVVARLMGLDQMPDAQEVPRSSTGYYSREYESPPPFRYHQQRKTHYRDPSRRDMAVTPPPRRPLQPRNCNIMPTAEDGRHGTRSLPDTPRMSSARRSWDTDPRLSLQLSYKENAPLGAAKELRHLCDAPGSRFSVSLSPLRAKSKRRAFRQLLDENRSPSSYATEIINLVKENVARRMAGRDGDEALAKQKCGTPRVSDRKLATGEGPKPGRSPKGSSYSPRLRIPDFPKKKLVVTVINEDTHSLHGSSPRPVSPASPPLPSRPSAPFLPAGGREEFLNVAIRPPAPLAKIKKANSDRFMERIRKPSAAAAREESFVSSPLSPQVRRKCRPSLATFVPGIRKETPTSPLARTEQEKHLPTPPALRQISNQLLIKCSDVDSREGGGAGAAAGPEEFQYLRCILERTGVQSRTLLPFATARWYSPSHPVDPILFHQLERSFTSSAGPLRHRCNRKLLFHLVDEVLADLLWPVLHATTWPRGNCNDITQRRQSQQVQQGIPDGEALMQRLWSRIRSYPSADCRFVQDIDALVEADLPSTNVRCLLLHPAVADEAGAIATALAAEILDSLLGDAAAALLTTTPAEVVGPQPLPGERMTVA